MSKEALRRFAGYLLEHRLHDLNVANLAESRALDVPLLRLFAHLTEEQLLTMGEQGQRDLLRGFIEDTAVADYEATLRAWEAGKLEGIPREAVQPEDMALAYAAQRRALLSFLPDYASDAGEMLSIVRALDEYYVTVQTRALTVFTRIRENVIVDAHEGLDRERRFLRAVVDSLREGLVAADGEGNTILANPRALEIYGMSGVAPGDSTWLEQHVFHADNRKPMRPAEMPLRRALRGETVRDQELVIAPPGREPRFIIASAQAITDRRGQRIGAVVALRDVSRSRKLETEVRDKQQRLEQLDRVRNEFLTALSFQLATPLEAILNIIALIEDGTAGPIAPSQRTFLRRARATSAVMLALVSDLVDFTRMLAARLDLVIEPVPPLAVVRKVMDTIAPLVEQQGQRIIDALPDALPAVSVDRERLAQVVTNLMHVAVRVTTLGGFIRVGATVQDDVVHFEVHTPVQILPGDPTALFERHVQVGGAWLGLSITKALVEALSGRVGVDSDERSGTRLWIELPVAPPT